MFDKPVDCRGLRESSPAGSDDKAPPCREQRAPRYSFFQGTATGMKDSGEKSVEQVAHRHFYTLALLFFKRA